MTTTTQIVPELFVVRLDTTENYRDGAPHLIAQGGRLFDVYLFDARRHVHCCELTPSYELHYLYSTSETCPDGERERERFNDELEEANRENELVIYVHVSEIGSEPKGKHVQAVGAPTADEWAELVAEYDGDRERAHAVLIDGQAERERCNWRY